MPRPNRPLTEKQQLYLSLLAEGLTYKEIASRCDRSYSTVKGTLWKTYINLSALNGCHAIALAFRSGQLE